MNKWILLTGCAGFIGSNFVKKIAKEKAQNEGYRFLIADALTYAGFYPNIQEEVENTPGLAFCQIDLCDQKKVKELFAQYKFQGVLHFAAESHVDRSITNPNIFVETNVLGTLNLLNESLKVYEKTEEFTYLQVSTDEVYGELTEEDPPFTETTPLAPNSPYSASKASADMLVRSFSETFGLPTITTRCSNNYGPYQFPEKLIPLMIHNALSNISLPVYGRGTNIRDWIYVDDHNIGVWTAYLKGTPGGVYNLGGGAEKRNIDVVKLILKDLNKSEELISFVTDRQGHDHRYAIDYSKAESELLWTPQVTFEDGIDQTIKWYLDNQEWVRLVQSD